MNVKYIASFGLLLSSLLCFGQENKVIKDIRKIIKVEELVFIEGSTFNAGFCSNHKIGSSNELFVNEMPYRTKCRSFYMSNHEVTVREYMKFILDVAGRDLEKLPEKLYYEYILNGKTVSVDIMPKLGNVFSKRKDKYLLNKEYKDFPIVGVSWIQANAYIDWINQKYAKKLKEFNNFKFSLPTAIQFENAYHNKIKSKSEKIIVRRYYPWNEEGLTNKNGKYMANFGQIVTELGVVVKKYNGGKFPFPFEVKSYKANSNKLYDLSGNVAEWTSVVHNDETNPEKDLKILVKGGSFFSPPFYLQQGVSQLIDKSLQHDDVGFRVVVNLSDQLLTRIRN